MSVGSRALGHGFLPGYGYAREFRSSADWYSHPSDRPSVSVSARHGSVPTLFSRPLLSESLSSSPAGFADAVLRHCSYAEGPVVPGAVMPVPAGPIVGDRLLPVNFWPKRL